MLLPHILLRGYCLHRLVIPLQYRPNIVTSHLIFIGHSLSTNWFFLKLILILPVHLLLLLRLSRRYFWHSCFSHINPIHSIHSVHHWWHLLGISLALPTTPVHRGLIVIPISGLYLKLGWFLHWCPLRRCLGVKHGLLLDKSVSLTQLHFELLHFSLHEILGWMSKEFSVFNLWHLVSHVKELLTKLLLDRIRHIYLLLHHPYFIFELLVFTLQVMLVSLLLLETRLHFAHLGMGHLLFWLLLLNFLFSIFKLGPESITFLVCSIKLSLHSVKITLRPFNFEFLVSESFLPFVSIL